MNKAVYTDTCQIIISNRPGDGEGIIICTETDFAASGEGIVVGVDPSGFGDSEF